MIKKTLLITIVPMTLMLEGAFVMEKDKPLLKVETKSKTVKESTTKNTVKETKNSTVQKGSGLYYENSTKNSDGKDATSKVNQYQKNKRLILTPAQKYVAVGLTNIFEYSSVEETAGHGYEYCEIPDAPHGITSGKVGVATATGSTLEFVEGYYNKPPMKKYIPELKRLAKSYMAAGGGTNVNGRLHDYNSMAYIDGLGGKEAFCKDWLTASKTDPAFNRAQDKYIKDMRYLPAVLAAEKYNLHLPISIAFLYDTHVLQGNISNMVENTGLGKFTGSTPEEEVQWLRRFNQHRINFIEAQHFWGSGVSIRPKSHNRLLDRAATDKKILWLDIDYFTAYYQNGHETKYHFDFTKAK
ncbi:MAG: chitosanase [Sulfurovum sp.]|nr:chitosanase [Sulfurovum sp.]